MKVLVDTNVILDLVLDRRPFSKSAGDIWNLSAEGALDACVAVSTVRDAHYVVSKETSGATAREFVKNLITSFKVIGVEAVCAQEAICSTIPDFEDALLHAAAIRSGCDTIVTRNKRDFKNASMTVLSPEEFLKRVIAAG